MKRILVTGGAGFIGSTLVKYLLSKKANVTVFDNFSFGNRKHIPKGVKVVRGDLRRPTSIKRVLSRRYDAVFHMAALHFIPYCNQHPKETIAVNVEGTLNLLAALRDSLPKKFFFASTAAVYDVTSEKHHESDLPMPIDIYGISKLAGEHLVRQFQGETDVPCAIGRLFNAYGPYETNPHLIPHIMEQLKHGKRTLSLGNLYPYRDYIHTSDMVRAIYGLARNVRKGVALANIASGDEYTVQQVVDYCAKILKEPIKIKSRATLRRRVERLHLRGDLRAVKKLAKFKKKVRFRDGLKGLMIHEGIL